MNFAIILAAGQSKRTKGINKLFFKIKGKPLIFYTLRVFEKHPQIKKMVLVTKKIEIKKFSNLVKKYRFKKVRAIVNGGKERQDSALAGLKATENLGTKKGDLLLFHNGANPLVAKKEIQAVVKTARQCGAATIGQMAKDTIKETNERGFIIKTLDRKKIFLAQTPQAIEYALAKKAFEKAYKNRYKETDDVGLVERLRKPVRIVPCSSKNIKVTTKDDLKIIENFLDK
jgi:2-C-methyl-D-erythritol 4-phosphate cytidylyltransferase